VTNRILTINIALNNKITTLRLRLIKQTFIPQSIQILLNYKNKKMILICYWAQIN